MKIMAGPCWKTGLAVRDGAGNARVWPQKMPLLMGFFDDMLELSNFFVILSSHRKE